MPRRRWASLEEAINKRLPKDIDATVAKVERLLATLDKQILHAWSHNEPDHTPWKGLEISVQAARRKARQLRDITDHLRSLAP
jgi:hypothetical protein